MAIQPNKIDVEGAKRKADEAAGAAKVAVENLKAMGFNSRAEAEAEVVRLDAEVVRLEAEANAAYTAFVNKWGEALNAT